MSLIKKTDSIYRDPAYWKKYSSVPSIITKYIEDIFQITGEVFPGRWEMQASMDNEVLYPRPVIHFPEITLKNRSSKSMKLKDLYVTFYFKPYGSGIIIPQLQGMRTTYTPAQFTSGFMHSHLSSPGNLSLRTSKLNYDSFCLGNGGINAVMDSLATKWTKDIYRLFLMNITTFLEWESLDGGPYIRMSNVFNRSGAGNRELSYRDALSKAKALQLSLNPDVLEIKYIKGIIRIVENEKLNDFLVRKSSNQDLVYVDEVGKTYPIDVVLQLDNIKFTSGVKFMDKQIPIVIEGVKAPINPKKSIHPLVKGLFISYVESILNKKIIDEYYGIKEQSG